VEVVDQVVVVQAQQDFQVVMDRSELEQLDKEIVEAIHLPLATTAVVVAVQVQLVQMQAQATSVVLVAMVCKSPSREQRPTTQVAVVEQATAMWTATEAQED
jgi:hypothetical protein